MSHTVCHIDNIRARVLSLPALPFVAIGAELFLFYDRRLISRLCHAEFLPPRRGQPGAPLASDRSVWDACGGGGGGTQTLVARPRRLRGAAGVGELTRLDDAGRRAASPLPAASPGPRRLV